MNGDFRCSPVVVPSKEYICVRSCLLALNVLLNLLNCCSSGRLLVYPGVLLGLFVIFIVHKLSFENV